MSTDAMAPQEVRDGSRIIRFTGVLIARSSSERPNAPRWSELSLYSMVSGQFMLGKVGRTTVAHDPECPRVTRRMPSWLEAREEARVRRTPCPECGPVVGDLMDPHTRLEPQRYTAMILPSLDDVVTVLSEGRGREQLPPVIDRLLRDAVFWREHSRIPLSELDYT